MIADEPRCGSVVAVHGGRGRDQHLERQLRERTGWHDEKMLALDEVLDLAEKPK